MLFLDFISCYFYNCVDSVYQLVPCLLKYSHMKILQHISECHKMLQYMTWKQVYVERKNMFMRCRSTWIKNSSGEWSYRAVLSCSHNLVWILKSSEIVYRSCLLTKRTSFINMCMLTLVQNSFWSTESCVLVYSRSHHARWTRTHSGDLRQAPVLIPIILNCEG
jgi:hypothetical protein